MFGVLLINVQERLCSWAGRCCMLGQDWSLATALVLQDHAVLETAPFSSGTKGRLLFLKFVFCFNSFSLGRRCNVLLSGWGAGSLSSFWPVAPLTPPPTCTCVCLSWPETTCTRQVSEGWEKQEGVSVLTLSSFYFTAGLILIFFTDINIKLSWDIQYIKSGITSVYKQV